MGAWRDEVVSLRRRLHAIPELSLEEHRTRAAVGEALSDAGIPWDTVTHRSGGTGIVARLSHPDPDAPTVAIRAELDALPGEERTGLPFASSHPGAVHACGHDAHMAMVFGAGLLLRDTPPPGHVVLLFQPAEERGGGARRMIEAGALDGVDAIFGGHVTHHYPVGEIMVSEGVITARSDRFLIRVTGASGHGARPHEAIDAIAITGLLISAIQSLVPREIDPVHPTVVSLGRVQAGTAPNVIAGEAELEGSIRTTAHAARERIHAGLRRVVRSAAELHGARAHIDIVEGYPSVVNPPAEADLARAAARAVVGEAAVVSQEHPSLGSEDFSFYQQRIPGCYVRFGARGPDWDYVPLHSVNFDVDEGVLPVGARWFARICHDALVARAR